MKGHQQKEQEQMSRNYEKVYQKEELDKSE